jgi:hypothetical protein
LEEGVVTTIRIVMKIEYVCQIRAVMSVESMFAHLMVVHGAIMKKT